MAALDFGVIVISNKNGEKNYSGGEAKKVTIPIKDGLDIALYKNHIYYKDTYSNDDQYSDMLIFSEFMNNSYGFPYLKWFDTTDVFKIEHGYAKSRNVKGTGMIETEIYLSDRKERFHILQGYDVSLSSFWYESNRQRIKKFMKRYYGKDVIK